MDRHRTKEGEWVMSRYITLGILAVLTLTLLIMFLAIFDEFDNIEKLTIQQNKLLRKEILKLDIQERILRIIIETNLDTSNIIIRRIKNDWRYPSKEEI